MEVDLTLEKLLVETSSRLFSSVSRSKTLTLRQKDFVTKKSTKLNKEDNRKAIAIDETKTSLNIKQFYYEVVPTNKTSLQRRRQCECEWSSTEWRGHRILPQDFSILHLASQGCYSVHSKEERSG